MRLCRCLTRCGDARADLGWQDPQQDLRRRGGADRPDWTAPRARADQIHCRHRLNIIAHAPWCRRRSWKAETFVATPRDRVHGERGQHGHCDQDNCAIDPGLVTIIHSQNEIGTS
jgi:hypothetical protein